MKIEEIYGRVCPLLFESFPQIADFPDDFDKMTNQQKKGYIIGAFTLKTSFKKVGLERAVVLALNKFNLFQEKLDQKPKREQAPFLVKYLTYLTGKLPIKSKKREEEKEKEEEEEDGEEEEEVHGGGSKKKTRKKRKKPNTKKKKTKTNKTRRNKTNKTRRNKTNKTRRKKTNKTRRNKTRRNVKTGGGDGITATGLWAASTTLPMMVFFAVCAIIIILVCVCAIRWDDLDYPPLPEVDEIDPMVDTAAQAQAQPRKVTFSTEDRLGLTMDDKQRLTVEARETRARMG